MSADMGECSKCKSDIRTDAERCPECGFEPGPGMLGGLIMWVSGGLATLFLTIAVVVIVLVADGFPLLDGLLGFALFGGIGAVFAGIVYAGYSEIKRGPTDPPTGTGMLETVESWDGKAAGEAAGERINSLGPAIAAALPPWTWTAMVLFGVVLQLSLWVAVAQESEIGMSIGILGGLFVPFVAIATDTHRIKWASSEYSPRWWFWTLPGILPMFGWIFGLAWLARKRQKIGSFIG